MVKLGVFWQHQWEHTSRASSCRLCSSQQFPFTPAISSAAHRLNFAAYHSVPWDLDFFFSLSLFFSPLPTLHLEHIWAHLPLPRRCLCGCNFYPAQLWDLFSAHTSAQEWMNAPTCICLIITRDVIRIIHVMTARRIGSCAQSQPKPPVILEMPGSKMTVLLLRAGMKGMQGIHSRATSSVICSFRISL